MPTRNPIGDDPQFSDAALSVWQTIRPIQVAGIYRGEPYAVALPDEHDRLVWYPASEAEASEHGKQFGWDRVAAVRVPGVTQ